jgi:trimethylamine---corrinoid protein Co-methyltransferase
MAKRNAYAGGDSSRGFGLAAFSDGDIESVHLSTLEVLERTGIFVEDDEALDIFADGGCVIDRDRHIARIPPHVVEEAVASAPARVTLCGRDPANDVVLEPGRVGFCTFSEGIMMIDLETGERRETTKNDVAEIGRLTDYLDEMDTYQISVVSRDVPSETYEIHNLEAALLNSTKPLGAGPQEREDTRVVIEMAAVAAGGMDELRERPLIYLCGCPVSPLKLPTGATTFVIAAARAGLPSLPISMALAGGSAPVTLAGALVTHNSEVLASVVLGQLTERGSAVIYGSSTTALDLRLAAAAVGSPECAMINAAVACLARRYRLPSFVAGA